MQIARIKLQFFYLYPDPWEQCLLGLAVGNLAKVACDSL